MRTLLTGFGPFGKVVDNPSARIVAHFAREGAPGHDLTTCVLPVSFARAGAEITALLRGERFDAAVLLGLARKRKRICLERYGRNLDDARIPDRDGACPQGVAVYAEAPERYRTTVALVPLARALRAAGLPVQTSNSAGAYVCNHVYYCALHALALEQLPTRCLFVHVPADQDTFAGSPASAEVPLTVQIEAVAQVFADLLYHAVKAIKQE